MRPAFIGLGAQRSGTSWIYACLYEHPQLYMPHKEINFFGRDARYERGLDWYERHFDGCPEGQLAGEYSTTYLDSEDAPKRIHDFAPGAKLIACLRDPAERAASNYRNDIMAGSVDATTPFETALANHPEWVERGLYHKQLSRYLEHFDRSQVLTLIYDDAVGNPEAFIRSIFEFLGVDPTFRPSQLYQVVNPGRQPRSVSLDRKLDAVAQFLRDSGLHKLVWLAKRAGITAAARRLNTEPGERPDALPVDRAELQESFGEDVRALESLLGRDLPGWLKESTTSERVSSQSRPMSVSSVLAPYKDRVRATLVRAVAPVAAALNRELPRRRVIALHEVANQHATLFEAKLRWLTSWCNVVSLSSLHDRDGLDAEALNVAITFDDGYADSATVAAPVLAELGLPATVFVCSGAVGLAGVDARRFARDSLQRRAEVTFIDADQLGALASGGLFDVGGHTMGHADLATPRDEAEWRTQVVEDRESLARLTGVPPRFFAYPFGQFANVSPDAVGWVREAGYDAAFTIMPSFWTNDRDRYLVGRDSLDVTWPDALWRAWLRGGYDALSGARSWRAKRRLRTVGRGSQA